MRKFWLAFTAMLLVMLTAVPSALAFDRRSATRVEIPAGQTVQDDAFLAGTVVTVDGTVDGDLWVAADSVTINGSVTGNLFVLADTLDVKGMVGGGVFTISADLNVAGTVDGSVTTVAEEFQLAPSGRVGRSVVAAGDRFGMHGEVGRGIMFGGAELSVTGKVGKEIRTMVDRLHFGPESRVAGPVNYVSDHEATVETGAQTGQLARSLPDQTWRFDDVPWYGGVIGMAVKLGGFLLVGMLLLAVFPAMRSSVPALLVERPWQVPLVGALALFVTPLAGVILLLTVVGIPLAGLVVLLYGPAIYLGQILISWSAGKLLADRVDVLNNLSWPFLFVLGTLITTVLVEVPYLGGGVAVVSVAYGLGALGVALVRRGQTVA